MKLFYYATVIILFMCVGSCQASEEISFIRIKNSISAEIEQCLNIVISNKSEWDIFCDINKIPNTVEIDFDKYVVAGVFLGTKPNPGHGVEIRSVKLKDDTIIVEYVEYVPNPFKGYIQVIVYPFDVVYFPKIGGLVNFSSSKKIR